MAEARNAIDLYYLQKQGFQITGVEDGYYQLTVKLPYPTTLLKASWLNLRNLVRMVKNSVWPASLTTVLGVISGVSLATVTASPDSWFRSGGLADFLWRVDAQANRFNPIHKHLAVEVRVAYLAAAASFVGILGIMTFEKMVLRLVLKFHPWVYTKPGKSSVTLNFWGLLVKLFSSNSGLTDSYGISLPTLPLPSLNHTVSHYLSSVQPLQTAEEFEKTKNLAEHFKKKEGWKLQLYLWFRWFTTRNYVAEWWEKYVYLRGRTPLAVNSNYYVLDNKFRPTKNQAERAANLVHYALKFKDLVENEQLKPLAIRGFIPLCMDQYKRMFGTCRVPGRDFDSIKHTDFTRHVTVLYRGEFFEINVYHGARGTYLVPFSRDEIREQIEDIMYYVDKLKSSEKSEAPVKQTFRGRSKIQSYSDLTALRSNRQDKNASFSLPVVKYEGSGLAALTAGPRSNWAEVREIFFSRGVNKASLRSIEKSAFVLVLDDEPEATLNARGKSMFAGNGFNRYFDKSISIIVFKDGYCGLNCEHSWADAPAVSHFFEWMLLSELADYKDRMDETKVVSKLKQEKSVLDLSVLRSASNVEERIRTMSEADSLSSKPLRLPFEIDEQLERAIQQAGVFAQDLIADVDLELVEFTDYGAGFMKKSRCSPDAFVQMALQLAYYRQQGRFDLTYESSMTRLFRKGRTETIRSLSNESKEFVLAMEANKALYKDASTSKSLGTIQEGKLEAPKITKEKLINLLHVAAEAHADKSKHAMIGQGIDRHLFSLYVTSMGFDMDSEFLNKALSIPWRLSTSQQPQNQTTLRDSLPKEIGSRFLSPGGGFGPVADDGYGISYMIVGDSHVFFHISSKFSAPSTSSKEFARCLLDSLTDLHSLLS